MEFLNEYGLFLAKAVTGLIAVWILLSMILSASRKSDDGSNLKIKHVNADYEALRLSMQENILDKKALKKVKKAHKEDKKKDKKKADSSEEKKRVFVLNFVGNIKASAAKHLREEITALLSVATDRDEVLVRLENAGGLVHEHGFAASQLERIRQRNIPLTVAVDKVAASGGYMMACVADKIIAAPFAILGSIGVLAQLPNFNKVLEKYGVEFEQLKAGEHKRTLTMFGKNTDEDRERFVEQLEDTHQLFKDFVQEHRPVVDIAAVATGEHWYGVRALDLKLVDELITSDDYLLRASEEADLYSLSHTTPKTINEKIMGSAQLAFEKVLSIWWEKNLLEGKRK